MKEQKQEIRTLFKEKRSRIPQERRKQAAYAFAQWVSCVLETQKNQGYILSFASFSDEIETDLANRKLAEKAKLCLPKVTHNSLEFYEISSIDEQLAPQWKGILEPIEEKCMQIESHDLYFALIPGLVFDPSRARLGYGKGHYDRFFAQVPRTFKAYGVGFGEQFSQQLLPYEEHDLLLDDLLLF